MKYKKSTIVRIENTGKKHANGKTIFKGAKGALFYYGKNGRKVYSRADKVSSN